MTMTERCRIYKDYDGIKKTMIWDDEDPSQVTIKTEQDIGEIVDRIARDRDLSSGRRAGDQEPTHRLPVIVWEDLKKKGIADDDDAFRKWLNSSEATPWRIWPGWM